VTTSGNSEAIRLSKSLFRAHPEFRQGHAVTATVIAPGQMLVSIADESVAGTDEDPIIDAFLGFLANDMERHPERLERLSTDSMVRAAELTAGIVVDDDEIFPNDVTI